MSWRCVIIDDEKLARQRLKRLLAAHADFELVGEAADAASAVRLLDEHEPDLCLLDVHMPEGDGFRVLREARHVPLVIFTTAHERYAVRAFEVHSLDYLLKPFGEERLAEALGRARAELSRPARTRRELLALLDDLSTGAGAPPTARPRMPPRGEAPPVERISARRGSRILLLDPADVVAFDAEETLVYARTGEGRFMVERTLGELEQALGDRFFRAHRACLVNVARIREIQPLEAGTYRIVFDDEHAPHVSLSRRQARKLRERFPW